MEKKTRLTKEEFNEIRDRAKEQQEVLKSWGKAKHEREQLIYAQGIDGNIMACAIAGDTFNIMSLLYDLVEKVAEETETDIPKLCLSFMAIYAEKCKRASEEKNDTEDKTE